jgi:hypothetical protein
VAIAAQISESRIRCDAVVAMVQTADVWKGDYATG